MKKVIGGLIAAAVVGYLGLAAYEYYQDQHRPVVAPNAATAPPPATSVAAAPPLHYPIESLAQGAAKPASPPLPALADSDSALHDALVDLFGAGTFAALFNPQDLIRRIVVTADNMPRDSLSQRLMALKPVPGHFAVSGEGDQMVIGADNQARYTPWVRIAANVDTGKAVAIYLHFYPLLQQAYQELGYPKGYFNDRLVQVIDDLLAAPEVRGPIRLVQPRVMYQFADPSLEARSAGQKMMIRMGADNAVVIKHKLREIRQELTRSGPQPR